MLFSSPILHKNPIIQDKFTISAAFFQHGRRDDRKRKRPGEGAEGYYLLTFGWLVLSNK
jgi:hypothetical protein